MDEDTKTLQDWTDDCVEELSLPKRQSSPLMVKKLVVQKRDYPKADIW